MTSEQIKANIVARKFAETLIQMGEEEPLESKNKFWFQLAEMSAAKINMMVIHSSEMNEADALRFEKFEMPYGKYVGETIEWIYENDPDYLAWLVENDFNDQLRKYLKSNRFRRHLKVDHGSLA